MNSRMKVYQLISAILLAFSISILMEQLFPVRAQENESQEFFDEGNREFEQEAETLEEPQNSNSKPLLTIDEEPPEAEVGSPEESEVENPQPTEAATESMEEQWGQQEQKLEQELNIRKPDPGKPKVEDVPDPNEELGLEGNEPFQPAAEEAEVEF